MHRLKNFFMKWFDISYIAKNIALLLVLAIVLLVFTYGIFNLNLGNDSEYIKTVITGIFAICASALAGFSTHEDNNRQIALRYITDKRADWSNEQNSITAELCKEINNYILLYNLNYGSCLTQAQCEKLLHLHSKIMKNITRLYLRYNFTGGRDKVILQLLRVLQEKLNNWSNNICTSQILSLNNFGKEKESLYKCLNLLILHSQLYYKLEWERSKDEAKYIGNIMMRGKLIKKLMTNKRLNLYKKQIEFNRHSEHIRLDKLDLEAVYEELLKEKEKV